MPDTSEVDPRVNHGHRQRSGTRTALPLLLVAVLALVAIGLSSWALLRPTPGQGASASDATYSDAERVAAKTKICGAFDTVRKGVTLNTNLQSPGGPGDITGSLAVAANARLSLSDGGQYLLQRLDPATSTDLADSVKDFANTLMDIGAAATAGAQNTDADQTARLRDADTENTALAAACQ